MWPTRVVFAGDLSSLLGFTSSKLGLTTVTNGWKQWPSHCCESPVQSYDCRFPKHLQGVSSGSSWPGTCQQLQRRFSMTGLLFVNSQCWARGRETALGKEIRRYYYAEYQSNKAVWVHFRSQCRFCLLDQGPLPLEIGNDNTFTKAFELLWISIWRRKLLVWQSSYNKKDNCGTVCSDLYAEMAPFANGNYPSTEIELDAGL